MGGRVAAAVVYVLLGLGSGYLLWGSRIGNLTEALDRMIIEDDSLRARLARASADGDTAAVLSTLSFLSSEVRLQAELVKDQARSINRLLADREGELDSSLEECEQVETRLQEKLEKCLFENAALEEAAAAAAAAAAEPVARKPRGGSLEVEKTVVLPPVPVGEPEALNVRSREHGSGPQFPRR